MAKGQKRSNREEKKPKKEKPKVAPGAPTSAWRTLEKRQPSQGLGKRK
jgi:hypothetical protein